MRRLTPDEIRFSIFFALQQAPPGLYVDIRIKDPEKRTQALEMLAGMVAARFDGCEVMAPDAGKGFG